MFLTSAILCAIHLTGVTGDDLRARAFFDANNVKVGDPLVLTVDFIGNAQFADLHPPALAKSVRRRDWKVDDASARTDTFRDARRLLYRVRPMREGVLWFPPLEFEYAGADGRRRLVRANEIPVHAKGGSQLVVEELSDDDGTPKAEALVADPGFARDADAGSRLGEDALFRWRRALTHPTADAFAEFDFPAARLNEATCALREGNWARAAKIYASLEWKIGQTPEIERGIRAVLAQRTGNANVELPVWRQVLRPLLRYGWRGRAALVFGGLAALAFVFWLLGRGIRAIACVAAAIGIAATAQGQDLFEEMRRMERQMQQAFSGFGFAREEREPVRVSATLSTDGRMPQVGDAFDFIVAIETPRTANIGQLRLTPSESLGLKYLGNAQNLPNGKSANPSNIVRRLAVPARYDVPFRGEISFAVDGVVSGRQVRRGGAFSMSFSNSFRCETNRLRLEVKPLPTAGQPADFSGIISEGLRLHEFCDILRLETNDVVTITYRMIPNGYVPPDFLPKGSAFEWTRQQDRDGRVGQVEYRRYFVADGAERTPELVVPYYDPATKTYRSATTGGTRLKYVPSAP